MSLFEGARLALDPRAANAAAAQMDPAVLSWAVQVRDLASKGVTGRWHAYALVRVEALAETGVAFTGGVYDAEAGKNLVGISQRIEGSPGATPDENTRTERTVALAESIKDGEYRLYDLGSHDFHNEVYVWFGTTGGVDPKQIRAIYVDRVIFVRE